MVVCRPVFGSRTEIIQRVVHPSHIPFIVEAQPALRNRSGNAGIRSRVFGREYSGGMPFFKAAVHLADEVDGSIIDASCRVALPVNDPADGIHADPVNVVFCQPVIGGRLEEASDFPAGMHEITASPFADAHILVRIFIESGAVIIRQSIAVHSKMNRYKIQYDPDIMLMASVDEFHQLSGRTIARGRTVEAGILIAPGFITGVFAEGHDLYIIVTVFFQIGDQDVCHLRVSIPVVCLIGRLLEGAEM